MILELPLSNEPEQSFSTSINKVRYDIRVAYNVRMQSWTMNLSNPDGVLLTGLVLNSGVDLLHPYNFGIGELYALNLENFSLDATESGFGDKMKLLLITED